MKIYPDINILHGDVVSIDGRSNLPGRHRASHLPLAIRLSYPASHVFNKQGKTICNN